MIEEALFSIVSSKPSLTSLIGTRFYGGSAPENTQAPYVVYSQVGFLGSDTLCGPSSLKRVIFQLDCYAVTYKEVKALARALGVLLGFRGAAGGVDIANIDVVNITDSDDPDPGLHVVMFEIGIWYRE